MDILSALGMGTEGVPPDKAGKVVADKITEFTRKLGLPQRLRDVGVPEAGLKECSELALSDGAIVYNPKFISDSAEVLKVYQEVW
jgi:alcohol dehydrogenase class IV